MDHSVVNEGDTRRIVMQGRFTFTDNESFRGVIDGFEDGGVRRYVLDLSGLEFMDSAGLGMLLLAHEAAEAKSRPLSLRKPQGEVKRMLEVSKFNEIITIED